MLYSPTPTSCQFTLFWTCLSLIIFLFPQAACAEHTSDLPFCIIRVILTDPRFRVSATTATVLETVLHSQLSARNAEGGGLERTMSGEPALEVATTADVEGGGGGGVVGSSIEVGFKLIYIQMAY